MTGLVTGFVLGLVFAFIEWHNGGAGPGHALLRAFLPALGVGLMAGLGVGIAYPQSWPSSLAFAQLAVSDRTPVRLMRFLEDARSRNVLRTVGPIYQFRHARLQDRLASQKSATGQGPTEPRPTTGDATALAAEPNAQAHTARPPQPAS